MHNHLHLGHHKTGTSSLRQVLRDAFGTSDPQPIWCPVPVAHGPGHAELAWHALGCEGRTEDAELLSRLAQAASGGGCRHLIPGSEAFIPAAPEKLHRLAELGAFGTLMPMVTRAPIGSGAWQDAAPHGPIALSPDRRGRLKRRARDAIDQIRTLEQSGHVIVYGDLDRLDDLPEED